jgi:hypothetical protein
VLCPRVYLEDRVTTFLDNLETVFYPDSQASGEMTGGEGKCKPSNLFGLLPGIIGGNSEVLEGKSSPLTGLDKTLPGNVRDFGYCQGNVRDYDKSP